MTEQTINNFLLINSKYFDMSMMPEVKLLLQNADESMAQSIFAIEFKDPTTLLIISILLGTYGIDRFMLVWGYSNSLQGECVVFFGL